MKKDIKSEIVNMKEGEIILFSIGLELALGLTSWYDIVEKSKDFNKKFFNLILDDKKQCYSCRNK